MAAREKIPFEKNIAFGNFLRRCKVTKICWKMPPAASKTLSVQRRRGQEKWFLEAEEWFNEKKSEWIFCFENICEALGLDPQYLRQRLMSWKRKRLAAA
jgi:hypothetical protein